MSRVKEEKRLLGNKWKQQFKKLAFGSLEGIAKSGKKSCPKLIYSTRLFKITRLRSYDILGTVLDAGNTYNKAYNRVTIIKLAQLGEFWPQEEILGKYKN